MSQSIKSIQTNEAIKRSLRLMRDCMGKLVGATNLVGDAIPDIGEDIIHIVDLPAMQLVEGSRTFESFSILEAVLLVMLKNNSLDYSHHTITSTFFTTITIVDQLFRYKIKLHIHTKKSTGAVTADVIFVMLPDRGKRDGKYDVLDQMLAIARETNKTATAVDFHHLVESMLKGTHTENEISCGFTKALETLVARDVLMKPTNSSNSFSSSIVNGNSFSLFSSRPATVDSDAYKYSYLPTNELFLMEFKQRIRNIIVAQSSCESLTLYWKLIIGFAYNGDRQTLPFFPKRFLHNILSPVEIASHEKKIHSIMEKCRLGPGVPVSISY